jgi:hypothetical protein
MADAPLPADFADLAPWVARWALPTEPQRNAARRASTLPELQAFYGAMLARMDTVVAYLDTRPYGRLDEPDQRLLELALSFMEIGGAVDVFHAPDVPGGFPAERFEILPPRRLDPTYL